jgi:hypothetical protein
MLTAAILITSALFGSMLFFSFVMAPLIFANLEAPTAARLIRAVFPWYYLVLLVLSGLAGVTLAAAAPLEAGIMLAIASLAGFSRQILMPNINKLRDRSNNGDERAGRQFRQLHGASVLINMVQLVGVTLVLIRLASA